MTLVRAELERFRHRAVLWLIAGLLLLAATGYAILAWSHTTPPSAGDIAAAQQLYDNSEQEIADMNARFIPKCEAANAAAVEAGEKSTFDCTPLERPPVESYLPMRPEFAQTASDAVAGISIPAMVAALAMGVSFVTAEFGSGSMGTWLTFVPRRTRVVRSKTAAAALGAFPAALAAFVVTVLGMALVYALRGLPMGDVAVWASLGRTIFPVLAAVLVAAVLGAGLGFAVRHAAAVAGIVAWWVVAVEVTLPEVMPIVTPATIGFNLRAWLHGSAQYVTERCVVDPTAKVPGTQKCTEIYHTVGATQGGLVVLAFTAVVLGIGTFAFRRRDVA